MRKFDLAPHCGASPKTKPVPSMMEQTRAVHAARLQCMTEGELAALRRSQGHRVSAYRGRFWVELPPGFLQPLHWMARHSLEEASPPPALSWGFRAVLSENDAGAADGTFPVHILSDVAGYTMESLSSNRRNDLRRCYKRASILEIVGPAPLREQGFAVFRSALRRTGYGRPKTREGYLADVETWFPDLGWPQVVAWPHGIILGAMTSTGLGGYLRGFAVDGTAYIEEVHLATEALPHNVGIGLVFEFVQACRRSQGIREIVYGQHSPEDKSLCSFKEKSGFPVKRFPTRVKVMPIVGRFLRWCYPHKYYRLTGRG